MAVLCLNFSVKAQDPIEPPPLKNQAIIGKIISALTGENLSGAVIKITNTNQNIPTNDKGEFLLSLNTGSYNLSVRSIGYKTKNINIEIPLKRRLVIELDNDDQNLKEVEIVSSGYQNIPKERATGSFAQPNREMYEARVSTNVISKLEGITNGLVFNSPGITGNKNDKLSIRGRSTIYANDNPLIVVDNFPYDGDINNINPNDIEDVFILKDAAASSIWGVQAGNGVIVITTKKGRLNQPIRIQLNNNITVSNKPDLFYDPNYLDAGSFIDLEKTLFDQGKYDLDIASNNPTLNTSTYIPLSPVVELLNRVKQSNGTFTQTQADEQITPLRSIDLRNDLSKYFYRRSVNQQYSLSLMGGSTQNTYYISTGYDKNLQNTVGDGYDRITLNTNNTFTPVKNFQLTGGISYVQSTTLIDKTLPQLFTGGNYSSFTPYTQLADEMGNPLIVLKSYSNGFVQGAPNKGYLNWQFSPVEEISNGYNTTITKMSDIRLNAGIKYTLVRGLSVEMKYQYDNSNTTSKTLAVEKSFYARDFSNRYASVNSTGTVTSLSNIPRGGILNGDIGLQSSNRLRMVLNFNRVFKKHAFNGIVGHEVSEVETSGNSYILYGYNDDLLTSKPVNNTTTFPLNPGGSSRGSIASSGSGSSTISRFRTYFANMAYTYQDKYTLSASGRIDASNYFGVNANQKGIPLWSTGIKWDLNKEGFYNFDWLPEIKLRVSYGFQGNLDKSLTAVTTFQYSTAARFTNATYATVSNYGNPDLQWEKTRMLNFGADFTMIHKVLSGSFEYYNKKGIDLIGFTVFAPTSGITNLKGNYAGTKGHGVDIELNLKNIDKDFRWETSYLFSWATDEVTKYNGTNITLNGLVGGGAQNISPIVGKPVYAVYANRWAGLDPSTGAPRGFDATGNISTDYATLLNPTSIDQLAYIGNARPVYFGGMNNRFNYKQFDFAFNISYKFDYYFKRNSVSYSNLITRWIGNNDYVNRWQKTGDEANTSIPSFIYPVDNNRDAFYNGAEVLVEKGDHIRLQDISLSYELDRSILTRLPFSRIKFHLYANNMGVLWRANKKGLDPDYPTGGILAPKTWAFGIKASL